jgi:hypothetical protein
MLPDMIDKPLFVLLPDFTQGWTRTVAHSLAGLVLFTIFTGWRLRKKAWPLVFAYGSHLVLDRMWTDGHILVWPLHGFFFEKFPYDHRELWWEKLTDPWVMGGEAIGFAVVLALFLRGRLWERERRRAFLATGFIA